MVNDKFICLFIIDHSHKLLHDNYSLSHGGLHVAPGTLPKGHEFVVGSQLPNSILVTGW